MNHNRNRHTGHMNAYKAAVVDKGKPVVIGKVLYFEREVPRAVIADGMVTGTIMCTQRVRALGARES